MNIVIDLETLRTTVKTIVDESGPEFVYNPPMGTGGTCVYQWDDAPSCLLGQALFRLGVSLTVLEKCDHATVPVDMSGTVFGSPRMQNVLADAGFELTEEAQRWGRWVQVHQDDHVPWGEAVVLADTELMD